MKSLIRGATAGTVATALMSAVMLAARRLGITGELPPEKITSKLLRRHGVRPDAKQQDAIATGLHFAFGAAAGGAFGVIARRVPVPSVPLGIAYGTAIWGVSYMGWLPAVGLMPRADHDQRGRQAVMLAGHLVFGATLGVLAGRRARQADADDDAGDGSEER
jgi:uncharacterized membrane protein YagU involved in acid resistance